MPVKSAIISDYFSVSPDTSVEEGLALLHKKKVRIVPVVDADGMYHGLFCYRTILGKLLPTGSKDENSWFDNLNFIASDSNDILPDKLRDVLKMNASEVMDEKRPTITPETGFWHMLLLIYKHDAPIAVMESKDSKKIIGIVSKQSSMDSLMRQIDAHS